MFWELWEFSSSVKQFQCIFPPSVYFFHVLTIALVYSSCCNKNTTTVCMHLASLTSPALAGRFFTTSTTWEAYKEQKFISHSSASCKSKIRVTARLDRLQADFIWCPHSVCLIMASSHLGCVFPFLWNSASLTIKTFAYSPVQYALQLQVTRISLKTAKEDLSLSHLSLNRWLIIFSPYCTSRHSPVATQLHIP